MKTILVVDDDSAVLDVVGRALEGYRVWLARDPDEGMQMAASLPTLELLVTDFMMPSMTGDELIGWLRAERPEPESADPHRAQRSARSRKPAVVDP